MGELARRYRDAREEAGLHSCYQDGARVEGRALPLLLFPHPPSAGSCL